MQSRRDNACFPFRACSRWRKQKIRNKFVIGPSIPAFHAFSAFAESITCDFSTNLQSPNPTLTVTHNQLFTRYTTRIILGVAIELQKTRGGRSHFIHPGGFSTKMPSKRQSSPGFDSNQSATAEQLKSLPGKRWDTIEIFGTPAPLPS